MAPPVADAAAPERFTANGRFAETERLTENGRFAEIARALAPTPDKWEFALRQAAICTLVLLVCEIYRTPEPALTAYVVFFLTRTDRASGVLFAAVVPILMAIVIALLLLLTREVLDRPALRVATIAGLSSALLFLGSASKLKPIGAILALIGGYALDLLGAVPLGEVATRAFLWAWLFAAIPAGVSIAVDLAFAPAPRRLAERAIARRLRIAAMALRHPSPATRAALAEALGEGAGEIPGWVKRAAMEKAAAADVAALGRAANSTLRLLLLVDVATRSDGPPVEPEAWDPLARLLEEMAAIFDAGRYPVEIEGPPLPHADTPMATVLLDDLATTLRGFAEPVADDGPPPPVPAPEKGGFFVADAFTNPDHVRHALKTTAAAMTCYVLYSILDWPGIHTCFITCYVVSLTTAAEAVEKLTLRILGCLIGAAAGIAAMILVVPELSSIGGLMILVFAGAFLASWVAASGPRIGYAGFQIAFAFFLCVIQGSGPGFDMVVARDRIIGILLGNLVCWVVFTRVWPVGVAGRIDPAIASGLRALRDLVGAAHPGARLGSAATALATGAAVDRDLALVAYEPPALRPPSGWAEPRARLRSDLAGLAGPLLLLDAAEAEPVAARLDRLATAVGTDAVLDTPEGSVPRPPVDNDTETDTPATTLRDLVERRMAVLERILIPTIPPEVEHAPV